MRLRREAFRYWLKLGFINFGGPTGFRIPSANIDQIIPARGRGRAHRVRDKASDTMRIGRFGWKAQQASLLAFGAEAYRGEMGIANDLFPDEACPGGECEKIRFFNPLSRATRWFRSGDEIEGHR